MGEHVSSSRLLSCSLALMRGALVKIIRVLGEGGFSFVYLAQDEHSGVRNGLEHTFTIMFNFSAETIRPEEDSLPKRSGGRQASDARSGSLQAF